jgi:hypothetical protein
LIEEEIERAQSCARRIGGCPSRIAEQPSIERAAITEPPIKAIMM